MVKWLRLHASTAGSMGLIPGWGTKILNAMGHGQKTKIDAKKKKKIHGKQKKFFNENIKRTLPLDFKSIGVCPKRCPFC